MSENIKHECGVALIRLLKPAEYYLAKYGTGFYGIEKLHLLMQKQHNRGQDGAGIASLKIGLSPGKKYIHRIRSNSATPIQDIFKDVFLQINEFKKKNARRIHDVNWIKENINFAGELLLGHLRYGTFGGHDIENLHPVLRGNNWKTRNLVLAGNFNMTNVDELFDSLVNFGQFPVETSDTITILEKIGHYLDEENEKVYRKYKKQGFSKKEITDKIARNLNIPGILKKASAKWDGGYTIAGLVGHGDAFVIRDPAGIRPAFFYQNDDIIAATSERSVLQTAFNIPITKIEEIKPGHALVIKQDGNCSQYLCKKSTQIKPCSFERIYFSRGNDKDIYNERKSLGKFLAPSILNFIDHDLKNTVFSFIPNTAAVAYQGLLEELRSFCHDVIKEKILAAKDQLTKEELDRIFSLFIRTETIAVKDLKLRTFITQDTGRDELVGHVYDVTYGVINRGVDNLVVIDDSIVRGTTLRRSIIKILDRLGPRRIVIASSAPQIRYPDCYGIDMAKLSDFIAFRAAIDLLKEKNKSEIINEVYKKSKEQENKPKEEIINYVKEIYKPFTAEEISSKIAEMLTTQGIKAEIRIIYQSIKNLHKAIPNHRGDWYFTGDYPTPGGNRVVNNSFINYIEGRDQRAY
ncbi:MAG: amidophosphoribosyltransferase [Bacteroidales bacterium]|nr:amidophosphoribosyltransferase [Bacteroidales bacterium]